MDALCIAPKENFMSLFDGSCFESAQLEIFTFVREHPCITRGGGQKMAILDYVQY